MLNLSANELMSRTAAIGVLAGRFLQDKKQGVRKVNAVAKIKARQRAKASAKSKRRNRN